MGGAPGAVNPLEIAELLAKQKRTEDAGDPDEIGAFKARLWLDGPLAAEGRVGGQVRALFAEMSAIALRSPPVGTNLDIEPAYGRLGEIKVPALVIWGTLDFPHIQDRSRRIAATMPGGSARELDGVAHLPSLGPHKEVTALMVEFIRHDLARAATPDRLTCASLGSDRARRLRPDFVRQVGNEPLHAPMPHAYYSPSAPRLKARSEMQQLRVEMV